MSSEDHQPFRISQLISPSTIRLQLAADARDAVLRELVGLVPALYTRLDEQARLLHALIEREELHSTGIGDGLALPHTRNTLGGIVGHPVIVMGRHPLGIPFGAIDAKPVQLFFLLLATSVTQHLHLLARMSRLLRNAKLRQTLLAASSPDQVIQALRDAES
jgi:mannitol/fructose-specific phosphotransferase system IIA component (Ntr-type)